MKYAMLIAGDDDAWDEASQDQRDAAYQAIFAWMEKWQAAGKILDGGAELDTVRKARTVSRGADGQPVVTDGPYLELKEVIGGIILLQADDIDEAVAIAAGWPTIVTDGTKVEVRPVIEN